MRTVSFYDLETGEIVGHVQGEDFEIERNAPPGAAMIEGRRNPATHRVVDGEFVEKPPTPPRPPDHRELRLSAYPPLTDLADALYWRERGDDTKWRAWLDACDAVKKAHPKGNDR